MKCIWYSPQKSKYSLYYFILSGEFNVYLKQIKVILFTVKINRIVLTSDEYDFTQRLFLQFLVYFYSILSHNLKRSSGPQT